MESVDAPSVIVCWNVAVIVSGPSALSVPLVQEATPVEALTGTSAHADSSPRESEKVTVPLTGTGETCTSMCSCWPTTPMASAELTVSLDGSRPTAMAPVPLAAA